MNFDILAVGFGKAVKCHEVFLRFVAASLTFHLLLMRPVGQCDCAVACKMQHQLCSATGGADDIAAL